MKRLEKFLFYLFIFFIPLNTRLFLWQSEEIGGDFNKIFLYATDILIFGFLILWSIRMCITPTPPSIPARFAKTTARQAKARIQKLFFYKANLFLLAFLFISLISLIKNFNIISGYFFLKLIEMSLLYFYIKSNKDFLNTKIIFCIFVIAALLQVGIADLQFHFQSDSGLKFLGEPKLSTAIPGVAEFVSSGAILMRSYGTLPHPNILAAFLFATIFMAVYLLLNDTPSVISAKAGTQKKLKFQIVKTIFYTIILFFLTWGIYLTFSRISIILFLILIFVFLLFLFLKFKDLREKIIFLAIIFLLINCSLFFVLNKEILNRFSMNKNEQAINLRIFYNNESLQIIKNDIFFGVSPNNFVNALKIKNPDLPDWTYQPTHNIYLLIAAEIGIFGLIAFLLFLLIIIKNNFYIVKNDILRYPRCIASENNNPALYSVGENKNETILKCVLLFIFVGFLIWGIFDHFFWTIEQGRLLFWITLGLLAQNYQHKI